MPSLEIDVDMHTHYMIEWRELLFPSLNLSKPTYWLSMNGILAMCDVHDYYSLTGIWATSDSSRPKIISNSNAFKSIKNNDLVCLNGYQLLYDFVPNYYLKFYQNKNISFTIFSWLYPYSFPSELIAQSSKFSKFFHLLLNENNIQHIYVVDFDGSLNKNNKISGIPLGIDYHRPFFMFFNHHSILPISIQKQEKQLNELLLDYFSDDKYYKRQLKIYCDALNVIAKYISDDVTKMFEFENLYNTWINTQLINKTADMFIGNNVIHSSFINEKEYTFNERRIICRYNMYHKVNSLVDFCDFYGLKKYNQKSGFFSRKSRLDSWRTMSKYVFVFAPFGKGLDCYRMWESLIFGHIVITETSSLDPLYDGLPVVILKSWDEINQQNLLKWYNQYFFNQTAKTNENVRKRLTSAYWMKKMKSIKSNTNN